MTKDFMKQDLTEKEKELTNQVRKFLPNIELQSMRGGNDIGSITNSYFSIPTENSSLYNSQYFYKGDYKFIHFTSINALQLIISTKVLRLYNLYNLNDPREYSFAANLFEFNSTNKVDAKTNMFLLSMCKTDILSNTVEHEFNMWRLYGNNGNGVCIELDFSMTPPKNWKDFYLSEIFYGKNSKANLKELKDFLRVKESETPKTTIDLGQIMCFHKSNLYKLEKEVRLLYDMRKEKVFGATSYTTVRGEKFPNIWYDLDKSHSDKEILYLDLPLYHKGFKEIESEKCIPVPKITKIILGYNYKGDNYDQTSLRLSKLAVEKLGYKLKIEPSRLTKFYHELD